MKVKSESKVACRAQLLATPWTGAYQAPPSMGFSRQEYWSRVPLPSLYRVTNLPNFGIFVSKGIGRPEERKRDGRLVSQWSSQNTHNFY